MTTLYKLTDSDMRTRKDFRWGLGKTFKATGRRGQGLCSSEFIHAYEHPELALFLNPIHANYLPARLFEAEGEIEARDGQLKVGVRSLTLIRELAVLEPTLNQRIAFGIYCAKAVYDASDWVAWADAWLSGENRTVRAAYAAYDATYDATYDAAYAAAYAARAAYAACAAYDATYDAAYAAYAACAAYDATYDAAYAAYAAAYAACAAYDAYAATYDAAAVNLQACAVKALAFERVEHA